VCVSFVTVCTLHGRWKLSNCHKVLLFSGGLGGEKAHWSAAADALQGDYDSLAGDILICCGIICYLSPFSSAYRWITPVHFTVHLICLTHCLTHYVHKQTFRNASWPLTFSNRISTLPVVPTACQSVPLYDEMCFCHLLKRNSCDQSNTMQRCQGMHWCSCCCHKKIHNKFSLWLYCWRCRITLP